MALARSFSHVDRFLEHRVELNEHSDENCHIDVLCTSDMAELCHWLCVFMKEARGDDGQPYTPHGLTQLLSGVQPFIYTSLLWFIYCIYIYIQTNTN